MLHWFFDNQQEFVVIFTLKYITDIFTSVITSLCKYFSYNEGNTKPMSCMLDRPVL